MGATYKISHFKRLLFCGRIICARLDAILELSAFFGANDVYIEN